MNSNYLEEHNLKIKPTVHQKRGETAADATRERHNAEMECLKKLPNDFAGAIKECMQMRNLDYEDYKDLADAIGEDYDHMQKYLTGEKEPSIQDAVLICLGLQIPPYISFRVLETLEQNLNYYDTGKGKVQMDDAEQNLKGKNSSESEVFLTKADCLWGVLTYWFTDPVYEVRKRIKRFSGKEMWKDRNR